MRYGDRRVFCLRRFRYYTTVLYEWEKELRSGRSDKGCVALAVSNRMKREASRALTTMSLDNETSGFRVPL